MSIVRNNLIVARLTRRLPRKKLKFWRWFRTIPIAICTLLICISLVFAAMPMQIQRTLFYPVKYPETVIAAAQTYDVDEYLICAIIKVESNWQDGARSSAGAIGLMQMMEQTAEECAMRGLIDSARYPIVDLRNPRINIMYGTCYLSYLLSITNSQDEAIAAYNAGPSAASSWVTNSSLLENDFSETITYPETRAYLDNVTDAYAQYTHLYPEGINA